MKLCVRDVATKKVAEIEMKLPLIPLLSIGKYFAILGITMFEILFFLQNRFIGLFLIFDQNVFFSKKFLFGPTF